MDNRILDFNETNDLFLDYTYVNYDFNQREKSYDTKKIDTEDLDYILGSITEDDNKNDSFIESNNIIWDTVMFNNEFYKFDQKI